jgi:hypothetical protein
MDLTTLFTLFYNLFINYSFGDVILGGIFTFFIIAYIAWKMHLSPDGWVVLVSSLGILLGTYYFIGIEFAVITAFGIGFLIFLLLKRMGRTY